MRYVKHLVKRILTIGWSMGFKTVIAGSRIIVNYQLVERVINESKIDISEAILGGARGVDSLAFEWAVKHNVPHKETLPNYALHGRRAPNIRNTQMANYGNALILIWDGCSSGSRDMLSKAMNRNFKIYKHIVPLEEIVDGLVERLEENKELYSQDLINMGSKIVPYFTHKVENGFGHLRSILENIK